TRLNDNSGGVNLCGFWLQVRISANSAPKLGPDVFAPRSRHSLRNAVWRQGCWTAGRRAPTRIPHVWKGIGLTLVEVRNSGRAKTGRVGSSEGEVWDDAPSPAELVSKITSEVAVVEYPNRGRGLQLVDEIDATHQGH